MCMYCLKIDKSLKYLKLCEKFSTSGNKIYSKIYEEIYFYSGKIEEFH